MNQMIPGNDRAVGLSQGKLSLADLEFTDLYISESGVVRIRGMQDAQGPLVEIPRDFVSDIEKIHRVVLNKGQTEGEFSFDHDGVRYRATRIDAQGGIWYALRRLMFPIPRVNKLGLNPMVVREIGRLGKRPNSGMVLVAGATGNGKTTTACSILQEYLVVYGDMGVTIEDPPELKLEGAHGTYGYCLQNKVRDGDFAGPLRSVLRQNPRYILLGEIRDSRAASEALRAAISGHVVISTIHAGSIREAITSMLKLVSVSLDLDLAKQMLGDGLAAVLHQQMNTVRATDGRTSRRISVKSLFMGDEAIRAKIRGGQIQQLETDIERQDSLMRQSKSPVGGKGNE